MKFGRTAQTLEVAPNGNSHYDSLQVRQHRQFQDYYQLGLNYTWSKTITPSGANNSDDTLRIPIPEYYYLNRSLSIFDRPHNLQITNLIEIPFGKGRRYLNNG